MKMFKALLSAVVVFTAMAANAQTSVAVVQAPTADDIIAKNIDAMGGAAKITTLTSVKMSGSMSANGMDIPVTITKVHNKGMRLDLDIMGTNNYQIMTPDKGYLFFPIQQMTEPKEMDADMVSSAQPQLDIQGGSLFNYKDKGTTVELVGTEKVEGAQAYHLKATMKGGKVTQYWIDTKTNRIIKTSSKAKGPDGNEMDYETVYSDYKQNADGYWFPYTVATPNGPLTFDKIESNVTVDDSIFKN